MATKVNCTIDTGGTGDYDGWASANADYYGAGSDELTTVDKDVDITLISTDGAIDTIGQIALLFDCDATRNLSFLVPDAYLHPGHFPDTPKYRAQVSDNGITISADYTTIDGIAFRHSTTATSKWGIYFNGCNESIISRCVVFHYAGGHNNSSGFGSWAVSTGERVQINNSFAYNYTSTGSNGVNISGGDGGGDVEIFNCAFLNNYWATLRASGKTPTTLKNSVVFDAVNNGFVGTYEAASTNNAYSAGSDPGSDGIDLSGYSDYQIFVDSSNSTEPDLHLVLDSPLQGAGVDLSSDFSNDIAGVTRLRWDVGPFAWNPQPTPVEVVLLDDEGDVIADCEDADNWVVLSGDVVREPFVTYDEPIKGKSCLCIPIQDNEHYINIMYDIVMGMPFLKDWLSIWIYVTVQNGFKSVDIYAGTKRLKLPGFDDDIFQNTWKQGWNFKIFDAHNVRREIHQLGIQFSWVPGYHGREVKIDEIKLWERWEDALKDAITPPMSLVPPWEHTT